MVETGNPSEPDRRLFVNLDFEGDFLDVRGVLNDLAKFNCGMKIGSAAFLHPKATASINMIQSRRFKTFADLKINDDPDQISAVVRMAEASGHSLLSVAAHRSPEALIQAALTRQKIGLVAALSPPNAELNFTELKNLKLANDDLDPDKKINIVMCNVDQIEEIKSLGGFAVIATGIRFPGEPVHDQPAVATPAEAFRRGADILAVGRSITAYPDRADRAKRIIADYRQVVE